VKVEELALTTELAAAEVKALKQAVKQNAKLAKEQLFRDQMKVYGFFNKHGGKPIEIWESFKKAGLNADGDPRLAICRADAKECFCQKHEDGSAIFTVDRTINYWDPPRKTLNDVAFPAGTFQWQKKDPAQPLSRWNIKNEKIKTLVPIIPARLLPIIKHKLSNYHMLWEVEKWEPSPPKDPILLKLLTPNVAAVLATWELTPLERAIIRGRTQ
jgi:hypothetical protein